MEIKEILLLFLVLPLAFPACSQKEAIKKKDKPVVVILGLDGASWELIDPLIAKGRLPLFKELKEKHAWGYLRTVTPAKSPVIWTSIATGKNKAKHGIEDFRSKIKIINRKGKYPIASGLDIREPLLWEMLSDRDRRSVLVNWYLSYPPQPFNGVNVSDYFSLSAISSSAAKNKQMRQSVFPPERAAELEKFIDRNYSRVLKKMNLPDYPALYEKLGSGMNYTDFQVFNKIKEFVMQEGVVEETAAHLFRSEDFDLFAAYFKLADEVQHFAYMSFVDEVYKKNLDRAVVNGKLLDTSASEAYAKVADILCPVYQNLERIISRYFEEAGNREAYFIILSDHGFSFFFRDGTVHYNHIGPEKAPDGILIVRGPGVKPGKIKMASIFDIAPTVLYLLGLPLDRRMDGEPLRRLFTFKRESRYAVYKKKKPQAVGGNREVDEKKLQELKALGYIN